MFSGSRQANLPRKKAGVMTIRKNDRTITEISTVFALLLKCPYQVDIGAACPFTRYRKTLTLEEKFALAEELSDEERLFLLDQHRKCSGAGAVAGWRNSQKMGDGTI